MKKHKRNLGNITLGFSDLEAIICALPLAQQIPADSPDQQLQNDLALQITAEKLLDFLDSSVSSRKNSPCQIRLTPNDHRVIYCAITAALAVLSGKDIGCDFQIDNEHRTELSKHYFSLNRLSPSFEALVDQLPE